MTYELKAEHRPVAAGRVINTWHIVRDTQGQALCGRELSPDAPTRSIADLPELADSRCEVCRGAYFEASPSAG